MKGYYHAPEETAAAMDAQGWFNTRDLARIEDGYLFIVGRTKELIVRFGFNVYPAEVEAVLNNHPQVLRSAVIGKTVAGVDGGEEVIAFVQTAPGSPLTATDIADHAAVIAFCRANRIELVVVGPETPLCAGIVDDLEAAGKKVLDGDVFEVLIVGAADAQDDRQFLAELRRLIEHPLRVLTG